MKKWIVITWADQYNEGATVYVDNDEALEKFVAKLQARHQSCTAYLIGEHRDYTFQTIPKVVEKKGPAQ